MWGMLLGIIGQLCPLQGGSNEEEALYSVFEVWAFLYCGSVFNAAGKEGVIMDWENFGLGALIGATSSGFVLGGIKLCESLSASRKCQEGLKKVEEVVKTGKVDPRFLKVLGLSSAQEDEFPGLEPVGMMKPDVSPASYLYQASGLDTQPDWRFQLPETSVFGSLMTRALELEVLECIQSQVKVQIPEAHQVIWAKPMSSQELRAMAVRPGPGSYQ